MDAVVKVWAALIKQGKRTLEECPEVLRERVEECLKK